MNLFFTALKPENAKLQKEIAGFKKEKYKIQGLLMVLQIKNKIKDLEA